MQVETNCSVFRFAFMSWSTSEMLVGGRVSSGSEYTTTFQIINASVIVKVVVPNDEIGQLLTMFLAFYDSLRCLWESAWVV